MTELPLNELPTEPPYVVNAPSLKYFEASEAGLRFSISAEQPLDQEGRRRTELHLKDANKKGRAALVDPDGVDMWSQFEFTVPLNWRQDPSKVVIHQWHHDGGPEKGRMPPLQVFLWNHNLYVRECHAGPGRDRTAFLDRYKRKVERAKRHRFTFHTLWDTRGKRGKIECWLDGRMAFSYRGVTGFSFAPGVAESTGLYWPSASPGYSHQITFHSWKRSEKAFEKP